MKRCLLALSLVLCAFAVRAQHHDHAGHRMSVDVDGMTMNANSDTLPRDCTQISTEHQFVIRAGQEHAQDFPGLAFSFDQRNLKVQPCSLVTVTLINDDKVRHQWMVHGLPRYLYPGGMFHLETAGGKQRTASFIVPGDDQTYLVHCDMAQHMEKGMKAQLVVGSGSGDLWAVPGVSDSLNRAGYTTDALIQWFLAIAAITWIGAAVVMSRLA